MNIEPGTWVILKSFSMQKVGVYPCKNKEEALYLAELWTYYDKVIDLEAKYNVVQWDSSIEKHVLNINHGNQ